MRSPSDIFALQSLLAELSALPRNTRPLTIDRKSVQDFVTDIDLMLEIQLRKGLETLFPGVSVLGEESICDGQLIPDGEVFLVDPLDGTGNWIAGLPFAAISVALLKDGQTVLAGVADIFGGTIYGAAVGLGAWRDETLLNPRPSPVPLIALSTGLLGDLINHPQAFSAMRDIGKLRNLGAQALHLCYVADGKLSLAASTEARLWDDAAGRLIVKEAGAEYFSGTEAMSNLVASEKQFSVAAHAVYVARALQVLNEIQGFQHLSKVQSQ